MFTFGTGPTLETDFNDVSADGLLTATRSRGSFGAALKPGDLALVADVDGNSCWGRVEHVQDQLYFVRPTWESWLAGAAYQITVDPANVLAGSSKTELAAV